MSTGTVDSTDFCQEAFHAHCTAQKLIPQEGLISLFCLQYFYNCTKPTEEER